MKKIYVSHTEIPKIAKELLNRHPLKSIDAINNNHRNDYIRATYGENAVTDPEFKKKLTQHMHAGRQSPHLGKTKPTGPKPHVSKKIKDRIQRKLGDPNMIRINFDDE